MHEYLISLCKCMSSTLIGSSALQHFECGNVVEIHNVQFLTGTVRVGKDGDNESGELRISKRQPHTDWKLVKSHFLKNAYQWILAHFAVKLSFYSL